jgi:hypothetical protein
LPASGALPCVQSGASLREEREHLVSHQMDGLCHCPNIAARFQTINAVRQDRSRVTAGQYLSFHQMLQEGKCRGSIGNGNPLSAAAEEVDHGYLHPRPIRENAQA